MLHIILLKEGENVQLFQEGEDVGISEGFLRARGRLEDMESVVQCCIEHSSVERAGENVSVCQFRVADFQT